eukprot:2307131-Rhodomonas_salina.1
MEYMRDARVILPDQNKAGYMRSDLQLFAPVFQLPHSCGCRPHLFYKLFDTSIQKLLRRRSSSETAWRKKGSIGCVMRDGMMARASMHRLQPESSQKDLRRIL